MSTFEHEARFPIINHVLVVSRLDGSAKFRRVDDSWQTDTYYSPKHRDFLAEDPVSEWLRIRIDGESSSICHKNWGKVKGISCEELETGVADPHTMDKILAALDVYPLIQVKKHRQTWLSDSVAVSIDWVEGLGFFIEIEKKMDTRDDRVARAGFDAILADLGAEVLEEDYRGYPMMLIERMRQAQEG